MDRARPALLLGACGWLMLACARAEPPRELRLELPDVISSPEPVLVQARAIAQDGTARDVTSEAQLEVSPAELAKLGRGGLFTCARSGEGTVSATLSGIKASAKFACKLAARLQAPERLSLDAAAGEVDLPVKVLDARGQELDLPLSVTSDRGSVVQARAGRLVPGHVGKATLLVRAGALSKHIEVEVARTLHPEVLPVDQNRRISYSLEAGKYELAMALPSSHKVAVDWLGAPYCAYRGEGSSHHSVCTLEGKGSVSFDNPAFLLSGDKRPSVEGVTLREVP